MPEIPCQYTGCSFKAVHDSEQVAIVIFNSHVLIHRGGDPSQSNSSTAQKLPPIPRPEIRQDVSEEDWSTFLAEWDHFKRCTEIPDTRASDHLYQCCEMSLRRLLVREDPGIVSKTEDEVKGAIKRLAVIRIANSVRRTTLLTAKQKHGEPYREFYANVKASALTCNFSVACTHGCCKDLSKIDYTACVIKDILIAGIADSEIRKEILGISDLDEKSDKDIVALVEAKEMAIKAWSSAPVSDTAGLSNYRREQKSSAPPPTDDSLREKLAAKGKCSECSKVISLYRRFQSGKLNKQAFKLCQGCYKAGHRPSGNGTSSSSTNSVSTEPTGGDSTVTGFFIGAVEADNQPDGLVPDTCPMIPMQTNDGCTSAVNSVVLNHQIFTKEGWQVATNLSHPVLRLRMSTNEDDYKKFNKPFPRIQPKYVDVVTDSGAQSVVWSRDEFNRSGFHASDLIPVQHAMKAANAVRIAIDGAILLRLSGLTREGTPVEAAVMAYISPDVKDFFLSKEAMMQLGIIGNDFPRLGVTAGLRGPISCQSGGEATERDFPSAMPPSDIRDKPHDDLKAECGCLKRQLPPQAPQTLPFPCLPENRNRMKQWLLETYAASTFNKCPHQVLPTMEGPPIQVHLRPDAKPVAVRTPAPVALHWQEKVKNDIMRDVAMGVLERVPHGEATGWCSRMVVTRKDDGTPRRTVDLSPLNKFCQREAHSSKSPFNLARSVPAGSTKTVFDAWNGYHAVPIQEEDRHLFTFTTPWGLFRYKRAPQGFLSSGDGYNRRFDDIAAHVLRSERCVDDTLLHDADPEANWWRAIEFLNLCGNAGIVLNAEKFQFAEETVDFAGFRITEDSVEPLPKYLDAIREFPTPKTTTDMSSWFGLVNQVSHYAQLRDMMEPFRKFLSPKEKFAWSSELDAIFNDSKSRIVEAIKEGVQIFDVTRRTCLRTDWSKQGIGYLLAQKHCKCTDRSFGCCQDGWRINLAGSRFLNSAEKNYAPVEGEALAVAWALQQTKYFTMGCDDLLVITDHKPLTKILGDRRLDEIENPRLFRLKRRTLMWRFEIEYQRGSRNQFADAMSRHPNQYAEAASLALSSIEDECTSLVGGICNEAEAFFAITWERVQSASRDDATIQLLSEMIMNGFPAAKKDIPLHARPFWEARDHLYVSDGVVLYKDRIVIPSTLRHRVIENLHSAHQGVSSMFSRAQSLVFWPGMTADIEEARRQCRTCHRNAPSHAKLPPTAPKLPTTPFQMVYADYFELMAKHYLIIVDRLSGWTELLSLIHI